MKYTFEGEEAGKNCGFCGESGYATFPNCKVGVERERERESCKVSVLLSSNTTPLRFEDKSGFARIQIEIGSRRRFFAFSRDVGKNCASRH